MDAETADLLRPTLDHVLGSGASGRDLLRRLEELGWRDLADDPDARRLLFEAQGRALAVSPALDAIIAAELVAVLPSGVDPADVAVVHATPSPGPAAVAAGSLRPDGSVQVAGLVLAGAMECATAVVPVEEPGGAVALVVVEKPERRFTARPQGGLDPDLGLVAVAGDLTVEPGEVSTGSAAAAAWERAAGAGRRALAHELVGVSSRMLELAVEHASSRVQFGRPIGSFQAVQHHLADCHVAIEAARTISRQSWETAEPVAGALAKAVAGRAVREAARQCQQVLGGIGFTWEHPLHRYIRRGLVLDLLHGSVKQLEAELGNRLVRERAVPKLVDLD